MFRGYKRHVHVCVVISNERNDGSSVGRRSARKMMNAVGEARVGCMSQFNSGRTINLSYQLCTQAAISS